MQTIPELIYAHHASQSNPPRAHMGCSQLGEKCERKMWLSFRFAVIEKFSGRILRLFRRGQNEEDVFIKDLESIGVQFLKSSGQHRVDFGGHVSGSLDGVIEYGLPDAPNKKHVVEYKTHGNSSFNELVKSGVEKSKPLHFVQMQVYMHGSGIDRALYLAVNKNTDELYSEYIRADPDVAEKYIKRGQRVALTERMPEPISTDPSWYECKICSSHSFCHKTKLTKEVNCRTCAHATPLANSTWTCAKYNCELPYENQLKGCEAHILHPNLTNWQLIEHDSGDYAIYQDEKGRTVKNGMRNCKENIFSSRELAANPEICFSGLADEWRHKFNAEVAG